jgi:DNA-binding transcriptional regulator GbsR (MarR family)
MKNVKIYREKTTKPKGVFSVRVTDEDYEFLKTFDNMSDRFHDFLEELRNEQRTPEAKGAKEIAEAHVRIFIERRDGSLHGEGAKRRQKYAGKGWIEEDEIIVWNNTMANILLDVASLTLKTPNPYWPESILYPNDEELEDLLSHLQSKEAKDFIQKIKDNVSQIEITDPHSVEKITPLSEDELNLVRKIFDETKYLLEQEYRRKFRERPPEAWHRYITDERKVIKEDEKPKKLEYQLP